MEAAVRENDFVLIICTPFYKKRADGRIGGVGYEGDILTGEVLTGHQNRKVIPVLRSGPWNAAAPSFCLGKYFIDLSSDPYSGERYQDLLSTLLGYRDQAPPLGPVPRSLLLRASSAEAVDSRILYPIEHGIFPVLTDSEAARAMLLEGFRDSLIKTFSDRPAKFAAVLRVNSAESNGGEVPYYEVWSHQKRFVFEADQAHGDFMREIIESRLSGGDREAALEKFKHEIVEHEKATGRWTFDVDVLFGRFPYAHWITYEPSLRRIQIKVDRERSADPAEYDTKVRSSSEALTYACALAAHRVAFVGDLAWQVDNFSLLKLTCFILDGHGLDFERFRFLEEDPETWDFRYPELETEVAGGS
jgi:hypothetical protein